MVVCRAKTEENWGNECRTNKLKRRVHGQPAPVTIVLSDQRVLDCTKKRVILIGPHSKYSSATHHHKTSPPLTITVVGKSHHHRPSPVFSDSPTSSIARSVSSKTCHQVPRVLEDGRRVVVVMMSKSKSIRHLPALLLHIPQRRRKSKSHLFSLYLSLLDVL